MPRRRASGDHNTEGLPATKNGNRRLRRALFMAATIARRGDPQLAEFFSRLTQRDKHYNKATMAAMNKLAGRIYAVLKREEAYKEARARGEQVDLERYVLRTPEGDPVAKDQARAMITERYPYRPKTKGQNPKGSEPSKSTEKGSLAARPLEAAS